MQMRSLTYRVSESNDRPYITSQDAGGGLGRSWRSAVRLRLDASQGQVQHKIVLLLKEDDTCHKTIG